MSTQVETMTSSSRPSPTLHRRTSSAHSRSQKKPWQTRRASFRSGRSRPHDPEEDQLSPQISRQTASSQRRKAKWWKIRLFKGMYDDVRRRAPFYWSDWRDAWDYRVVPATVYMYFAKYVENTYPSLLSIPHFPCNHAAPPSPTYFERSSP